MIEAETLTENITDGPENKHWYYAGVKYTESAFAPYALAIGQAALGWNSLQEAMGGVFWALMGGAHGVGRPMSVWQSLKADRPKRDMLQAAYKGLPKEFDDQFPMARADLDWLVASVSSLEDRRNNLVHAPLSMTVPFSALEASLKQRTTGSRKRVIPSEAKVVPQIWGMNTRANRISGTNLLKEFRWCRNAAIILRDFSMKITFALRSEGAPWPDRPRLPNRGETKS